MMSYEKEAMRTMTMSHIVMLMIQATKGQSWSLRLGKNDSEAWCPGQELVKTYWRFHNQKCWRGQQWWCRAWNAVRAKPKPASYVWRYMFDGTPTWIWGTECSGWRCRPAMDLDCALSAMAVQKEYIWEVRDDITVHRVLDDRWWPLPSFIIKGRWCAISVNHCRNDELGRCASQNRAFKAW